MLLSGSGDATARLWDMRSGSELFRFSFNEPCRAVKFSVGEKLAALTTDPFMNSVSGVHIVNIAEDPADQSGDILRSFTGPRGRIARVQWTDLNKTLITASEDGFIRRWDVETGKVTLESKVHDKHIMDLQMSPDGTHMISASNDCSAKLIDTQTLEVLKTFKSSVPVNSAAISPIFDHVLIGGGQDASQVTTTAGKAGHFEARFFHKIFQDEFGNVRGHFGPINAVQFSPDGTMFASGGEEGYVRLHHLDADYFQAGNP
jgi:translation initiation factor 3 subunit I